MHIPAAGLALALRERDTARWRRRTATLIEASGVLPLPPAASTITICRIITRRARVPAPIILGARAVTPIVAAGISSTVAAAGTRVTFAAVAAVLSVRRRVTVLAAATAFTAVPVSSSTRITVVVTSRATFVVPSVVVPRRTV